MSVVLLHGWSDVTSVVKEGGQMSIALLKYCQMSLELLQGHGGQMSVVLLKRAVRGWSDVASVVTRVVRCH